MAEDKDCFEKWLREKEQIACYSGDDDLSSELCIVLSEYKRLKSTLASQIAIKTLDELAESLPARIAMGEEKWNPEKLIAAIAAYKKEAKLI
jgi:hypothetical protein